MLASFKLLDFSSVMVYDFSLKQRKMREREENMACLGGLGSRKTLEKLKQLGKLRKT